MCPRPRPRGTIAAWSVEAYDDEGRVVWRSIAERKFVVAHGFQPAGGGQVRNRESTQGHDPNLTLITADGHPTDDTSAIVLAPRARPRSGGKGLARRRHSRSAHSSAIVSAVSRKKM